MVEIHGRDCSPLSRQPDGAEAAWLQRVAREVEPRRHVLSLGGDRDPDEAVVYCERDGTWWTGRYVGTVAFEGGRLTILPRFGLATLRDWLFQATNVALVESPGQTREDASFLVQLVAAVWARAFVEAARHGLPALKQESRFVGRTIRGRLDVPGTVRERALGRQDVVSLLSGRSLDNAASRALVAAYAVLRRWMAPLCESENAWLPQRARELLPHLIAVTGPRPPVPTELELKRVRYTPITAGFRAVAALSRQIALQRGLMSDHDPEGSSTGILLDVAELWELYVLAALRRAAAGLEVRHGTREDKASRALLTSTVDGTSMGTLKPDALVFDRRRPIAVVDAKYKRLRPTSSSPYGPQREDLYQLASYMARYGAEVDTLVGALIYPVEPESAGAPPAERKGPWSLDPKRHVSFLTLPHELPAAAAKIREVLLAGQARRPAGRRAVAAGASAWPTWSSRSR